MTNRYRGQCGVCGATVAAGQGILEARKTFGHRRSGKRWALYCLPCYNKSDSSGVEDRECGDRAYEDSCARACGM